MTTDLDSMSKKELEKLAADVGKALESHDQRKKAEARLAAEKAAREHGYSLDDLLSKDRKGQKSPPKYRNPEDPRQTWTGRGRQPGWIKQGLAEGKSIENFAI